MKRNAKKKPDIITFKVDQTLAGKIKTIPNRSDFIRNAVLAALDNNCPLCGGSGTLTVNQRRHWEAFSRDHRVEKCDDCSELHLVCAKKKKSQERKQTK